MINFNNDYGELACPQILDRLHELSDDSFEGYGLDEVCFRAADRIRKVLNNDKCDIHFLIGGTSANEIMISAMLKPYEAVVAVESGHINVHETGAIEGTGHKIEALPAHDGKINACELEQLINSRSDEHMVKPRAVYISNSTEIGTIYSKKELEELREVCDKYDLYLYMDGARLGAALTSNENDLQIDDLCRLCDCFYIGATKNGGLLGEAMVIVNDELKPYFRYYMKHHGGMLAKGFLLGIQFDCLFTDDLFFKLARHSNLMAERLKEGLKMAGIKFLSESPTNQQFAVMNNAMIDKLHEKYSFLIWEPGEKESSVRLVTSWHTRQEEVDQFINDIKKIKAAVC